MLHQRAYEEGGADSLRRVRHVQVKAILVAGGEGSRLYPFTRYTHKSLLPLHRRPVIDYALATIRRAGISDITIISNPKIDQIAKHVGSGLPGEVIHYVIEEEPRGVHEAMELARPHNLDCRLLVYFSDNITSAELKEDVAEFSASESAPGCVLLGRSVPDAERFGVATFDEDGRFMDIVEKPDNPPSDVAIGGIYLFDETFWERLDASVNSGGGAFSITEVNRGYLRDGKARLKDLGDDIWLDCGTPDALLQGSLLAQQGALSPLPCNTRPNDPGLAK